LTHTTQTLVFIQHHHRDKDWKSIICARPAVTDVGHIALVLACHFFFLRLPEVEPAPSLFLSPPPLCVVSSIAEARADAAGKVDATGLLSHCDPHLF